MKKINVILLIISFVLSGIGGIFLFDAFGLSNDIIQSVAPPIVPENQEITEYTYQDLAEYVESIDYGKITLKGNGSEANPFQVNSTEDFLWLMAGKTFDENKRGCLPEEYQEVSYLQSTGTQIIDTGVVVKNSIRPYIKFMASPVFNENGSVKNIFGGTDNNVPIAVSCNYGDGDNRGIYAWHGNTYGNGNKISSFSTVHGNVYELEYKERWWFNGVESTVTQQDAQGDSSNITIWFFGTNYCGDIRTFNIREFLNIYAFKLYDGEELIRDYVPCYRKSDNKPGMYDLVTNEFYTNQGEGEFNYGYGGKYELENNAYIEINSDIYINDETFDENGNPSGGDGVVCNWQIPIASLGNLNINGNENTIYNYFARTTDAATGDFSRHLFARSPGYVKFVKDLKLSGIYIYGGTATCVGSIGSQVYYIYNCSVLSGNVVAKKSYAGAFAGYINIEAKYCYNYANVYSYYQNIGGLFGVTRGKISYCNNYGNLTIDDSANNNGRIGGIVSHCSDTYNIVIENCNNYGNISVNQTTGTGTGGQSGGIVAWGRGTIRHCKNYGSISGRVVIGGIVGLFLGSTGTIDACENYGKIYASLNSSEGEIVGQYYGTDDASRVTKGTVTISNCYAQAWDGHGFFGMSRKTTTIVKNSRIDYIKNSSNTYFYLLSQNAYRTGMSVEFSNIEININGNVPSNVFFFNTTTGVGYDINGVKINNVIINSTNTIKFNPVQHQSKNVGIDGLIVNVAGKKQYYGNNFNGFYYSWKLGKIGLVALDGRGQFQGTIDEEWLKNKGFAKKSV